MKTPQHKLERAKIYYLENKERILKRNKNWRSSNKEKLAESVHKYYLQHRNIILQRAKLTREKNKECILRSKREKYWLNRSLYLQRLKLNWKKNGHKYLESGRERGRKWYAKNRKKALKRGYEYEKLKKETDKNFAILKRLRRGLRQALEFYGNGKHSYSKKYGINYQKIIEHLQPFPKDISNYQIDHIRPLSSFDLTNLEEIKIAFAPENHQWLTIEQNKRKGNKWQS